MNGHMFDYDATKSQSYFTGVRPDYVAALPDDAEAVILEIGCGDGRTGEDIIRSGKCSRYIGVEISPGAAELARERLPDVRVGNIETMDLGLAPQSLNAVIASEVLEHLVDPWTVVSRLSDLLVPGGLFLASSPNVSHHRIVRQLLRGRWDLTDSGPMDRTHLRWFTPHSYAEMFQRAGLDILFSGGVAPLGPRARLMSRLTSGKLDHLLYSQNNIHARKPK